MHTVATIIVGAFMLATAGVLVAGLFGMARGSDPRKSNKLMQYRVLLQAITILLFIAFLSLLHS